MESLASLMCIGHSVRLRSLDDNTLDNLAHLNTTWTMFTCVRMGTLRSYHSFICHYLLRRTSVASIRLPRTRIVCPPSPYVLGILFHCVVDALKVGVKVSGRYPSPWCRFYVMQVSLFRALKKSVPPDQKAMARGQKVSYRFPTRFIICCGAG